MFKYTFHCKKCGFFQEFPTKQDCALGKKDHKRRGCNLMTAPHKKVGVLVRSELALEARKGKEITDQALEAGTVSLQVEDEENDSVSE